MSAPCRHRAAHGRWRGDRGSQSLQFAIVVPTVLLALFGVVQLAIFAYARNIALTAAQEGARAQSAYDAPPGAGQQRAETFLATTGSGLEEQTVTVVADGRQLTVTVTGLCPSFIPGLHLGVRQVAHRYTERLPGG